MHMFKKYEIVGILGSVGLMAVALFLLRVDGTLEAPAHERQPAAAIQVVHDDAGGLASALEQAVSASGEVNQLVIDDVRIGTGPMAEAGDSVSVHYVGRLENGQEFDSSYDRGDTFTFTLGAEEVIAGWDEGVVGMQVGGQRVLVVPPDMAYGARGMGPIPPRATLLFMVELMAIN